VFTSRTHAVTFRVAESEYEALKETAVARGARSISDFARTVVMRKVSSVNEPSIKEALETLTGTLEAFDLCLRDLRQRIVQALSAANGDL
jgi:uncharacterized protein (DUF1778 family)